MFKKINELKKHHQFFYSLVILLGIVSVWRGVWGLFDLYVFPGNELVSYVVSILFGLAVLAGTHHKLS